MGSFGSGYRPGPCANCGKPGGGIIGSATGGHYYFCCSFACRTRLCKKIESGMASLSAVNNPLGARDDSDRIAALRLRIKVLEGQLRAGGIKPIPIPHASCEDEPTEEPLYALAHTR